jgi:hypothetical protein
VSVVVGLLRGPSACPQDIAMPSEPELRAMKQSRLRRLASQQGISEEELERADDSDDTKAALVQWLLSHFASASSPLDLPEVSLRAELGKMKQSALRRRAGGAGATEEQLDDADDAEDTIASLIELIVQLELGAADRGESAAASLRASLGAMKQSALRKRAASAGVSDEALDEADDEADTKAAIVELIVAAELGESGAVSEGVPPARSEGSNKPHHQALEQAAGAAVDAVLATTSSSSAPDLSRKWAMISYSWDFQQQAIRLRQELNARRGIPTWMDIDGGMSEDIYDSMAAGVAGAACVVALLSQSYQDSANCKLEFCFARDTGIPIIPVIVQPKWKATAWLGLLTSSALWTPLHEPSSFYSDVDSLIEIICKNGGLEGDSTPGGQPQHTPPVVAAVAVEKLEALRIQHAVSTSANHATKIDGLAVVPGGVPPVRDSMQPTSMMKSAKGSILSSRSSSALAVASRCAEVPNPPPHIWEF